MSAESSSDGERPARVLYCHCAYAKVLPDEAKKDVLAGLCASGAAFDAVADLCEMSARKDPSLEGLATAGPVKIAACFPRAVKWLFHAGGAPLPERQIEFLNLREQSAPEVLERLLANDLVETKVTSKLDSESHPVAMADAEASEEDARE